jgi:hypothetical protein
MKNNVPYLLRAGIMEPEKQPLLRYDRESEADGPDPFRGKSSVNTFPRQRGDAEQWKYCWEAMFSAWSIPRGYKRDKG